MFEFVLLAAVACGVYAVVRHLLRKGLTPSAVKGVLGERRVADVVKSLGFPALHDVYLASAAGVTQVDHIFRAGNAIVVIETKNLSGILYGTTGDFRWRQSFRRGDGRAFLNPVRQNAGHLAAVRAVTGPDADVRGLVVMAGNARFPQGRPDGVIHVSELKQHLRLVFVDAGRYGSVERPWSALTARCRPGGSRRDRADHMETVERRRGRGRGGRGERIEPAFTEDA